MTAATPVRPAPRTPPPPRPLALKVRLDGIPETLKRLERWVLWRYDLVDGEYSKVPYRPNGARARANDERTWSTFAAVAAAYRRGKWDGIGIALGDGLVGVDLDDVRAADGALSPFARGILDSSTTYHEVSPSGGGVKAYAFVDVEGGTGTGAEAVEGGQAIEIYKGCSTTEPRPAGFPTWPKRDTEPWHWEREHRAFSRWFAVTGHGNDAEVTADTAMVQRAVGELVRARSAKGERTKRANTLRTAAGAIQAAPNGSRHNALKNGAVTITATLKAQGLEDGAIESILTAMGETQGLPADEAAAVAEWAAATIPADSPLPPLPAPVVVPVSHSHPTTTPPVVVADEPPRARFRLITRAEDDQRPAPTFVLEGEVLRGGYHLIYGATGSGKTFYALDRSMRVAAQGGRCVYIATEDIGGLIARRKAWEHHNRRVPETWHRLDLPEGIDLADPAQVDELLAALAGLELDLITIDTLREAHTGDENSSQDGRAINAAVQRLIRATGAAVDVVHHSGVNEGRERGSTAIAANCDLKWKVTGEDSLVSVTCEKYKHGPLFTPMNYRITPTPAVEYGAVLLPTTSISTRTHGPLSAGERSILEALALSIFADNGAKTTQLQEATGVRNGSLFRALSSLKNRGFIDQGGKGDPYTITSAGRAAIGPAYQPAPGYDQPTTTEETAAGSATPTTTTNYQPTTTAPPPTTTTPTTRKGGSGGSGIWEGEQEQPEETPLPPAPPDVGEDGPVPEGIPLGDDDEEALFYQTLAEEEARGPLGGDYDSL